MTNGSSEFRTSRPSGAGWFIAGILVVAVILGGIFLFGDGANQSDESLNLNVELPALTEPVGEGGGSAAGAEATTGN